MSSLLTLASSINTDCHGHGALGGRRSAAGSFIFPRGEEDDFEAAIAAAAAEPFWSKTGRMFDQSPNQNVTLTQGKSIPFQLPRVSHICAGFQGSWLDAGGETGRRARAYGAYCRAYFGHHGEETLGCYPAAGRRCEE